jgi:cellulose synthase/poly-beta-1,6-N-acetylglucosamine synthase-like glycosyltransferase
MLHFSRKPKPVDKKEVFPSVSIVIATFNEEKVIARKLANTAELKYPRDRFEIVVIDSGSTDNTRLVVKDFAQRVADGTIIRLLTQEDRLGKSVALNYALRLCKSDIIVLSDADVMVNNDAILRITSNFNDERIGAVSGMEVMQNPDESSTTKFEQGYRSFYNTLRLGETNLDSVVMCESELAGYRRELIENIPDNSICDDMELTLQIRKKGFRAIYDPSVFFYEYSPSKYLSRIKHKIRRGQGNQQTLMRFDDMLFKRKYGAFSSIVLPFEFFMNIVSPILTAVCVTSYLVMILFYFNLFLVFLPLAVLALTGLIVFVSLRIISPATDITLEKSGSSSRLQMIFSVIDLISMEFLLLVSLFLLVFQGPKYKWTKIEDTRRDS